MGLGENGVTLIYEKNENHIFITKVFSLFYIKRVDGCTFMRKKARRQDQEGIESWKQQNEGRIKTGIHAH